MKIKNKTIAITGGTSGIGFQLVKLLVDENKVVVVARDTSRIESLQSQFPSIDTYKCDLSNTEEYESVVDEIIRDNRRIDMLINNAAIQNTPTFLDDNFEYKGIEREISINFTAICSLCYLFMPALLDPDEPSYIVNINSGLGLAPKINSAVYCATKAAINAFSKSLNYQLESSNIRVLQSFLPLVDTPMTEGRGTGKLDAQYAAKKVIKGIMREKESTDIGKTKILRILLRVAPGLAHKIMKGL